MKIIRILKLGAVFALCLLSAGSPQASPVVNGNSSAGDPPAGAISGQTSDSGAGKPGKLIIVYTGDLQGNMGPCG